MALVDEGAVSGIEVLENKAVLDLIVFNQCMMVVDVSRLKYRRKVSVFHDTRLTAGARTLTSEHWYQKVLSASPSRLVTAALIQKCLTRRVREVSDLAEVTWRACVWGGLGCVFSLTPRCWVGTQAAQRQRELVGGGEALDEHMHGQGIGHFLDP